MVNFLFQFKQVHASSCLLIQANITIVRYIIKVLYYSISPASQAEDVVGLIWWDQRSLRSNFMSTRSSSVELYKWKPLRGQSSVPITTQLVTPFTLWPRAGYDNPPHIHTLMAQCLLQTACKWNSEIIELLSLNLPFRRYNVYCRGSSAVHAFYY